MLKPCKAALAAAALLLPVGLLNAGETRPAVSPPVAAEAPALKEIVSKVPGDRRAFKIAGTQFSNDQTEATVTFQSSLGIFAFNLDLAGTKLKKLTLHIEKQKFCEGLDFSPKTGGKLDLRRAEGVKIASRGEDLVIEITAPALEAMTEGGRVHFINQYR